MKYQNKKIIIACVAVVLVLAGVFGRHLFPKLKNITTVFEAPKEKPKVVTDTVVVPETKKITQAEGRSFAPNGYSVPIVPKNEGEKVIVDSAIFTIKTGFENAFVEAEKWSSDAKLVYAKSLGSVALDGKSSAWQFAFGSKQKKKGYEIIIQGDAIASQKETDASLSGFDLPKNWYDSGDAIVSLQALPQFSNATMNSLIFFYNEDGKNWQYALKTSLGNTTMIVR